MRFLLVLLLLIPKAAIDAQTWKALEMHGGGKVTGIVFDPVNPNLIYNRTDVAGLNKSTDGGNTWSSFTLNIPKDNPHNFTTRNIAIDPLYPDTIYYCSGNAPVAGGSSIFKTLDAGDNWARITNPTNFSGNGDLRWGDETFIIHPTQTNELYVGGQPSFSGGAWQADGGLYQSVDAGNSWTSIYPTTFEKAWITAVKFHPNDVNLVYISAAITTTSGVSTTQKGLWEYNVTSGILLQLHNEDVAAFDFDAVTNKIIVCREGGISIYNPLTSTWSSIVKPFNANYRYYLRAHPTISGRWYFGASSGFNNSGLVETTDGGVTYYQVKYTGGSNIDRLIFPDYAESNTKPGHGNSLAGIYFNPHDPAIVFMDGVYKTTDAALPLTSNTNPTDELNNAQWNWTWVAEGIHIMVTLRVCPHPTDVEKFTVNVADVGEYNTSDGGLEMDYQGLLLHYSAATRYAKSNPDIGYTVGERFDNTGQIRKTINGGKSWFSPMSTNYFTNSVVIQDLQIMDTNPDQLVVGLQQNGLQNQIYRSLDGGQTWSPWDQGITQANIFKEWESIDRLLKDRNDVFYTYKNDKIYSRAWNDATWTLIPHPTGTTTINHLVVDPSQNGVFYITISNNQIYKWDNGTWSTISSPTNTSDLIAISQNGTVVVLEKLWVNGQRTQKLFKKPPGGSWSPLTFNGFGGTMKNMIFIDDNRLVGISNGQGANMIDYSESITCANPFNYYVANEDDTQATIHWNHSGSPTFNLEYKMSTDLNWTVLSNVSVPYDLTGLDPCMAYDLRLIADCGGSTSNYLTTKFTTEATSNYCNSYPQSVWRNWIEEVILENDTYLSHWNGGYYDWGCSKTTTLVAGDTLNVSLTPGYLDVIDNVVWYVWADLDRDGIWQQSELIVSSTPSSVIQNFAIPTSATLSTGPMKVRVLMHKNPTNNDLQACGSYSNGETEDFIIDIIPRSCLWVTNTSDSDVGSLRAAIDCAVDGDTIRFAANISGDTIKLTSLVIVINKDLTLLAELADNIYVKGESVGRVFIANIFKTISMKGIHIISGTGNDGRAIFNRGNLYLEDVNIYENPSKNGEGIKFLNEGQLDVKNVNFYK